MGFLHEEFCYIASRKVEYHEGASFSAFKAYNAMSWPGGAAIYLVSLVCELRMCTFAEIAPNLHFRYMAIKWIGLSMSFS